MTSEEDVAIFFTISTPKITPKITKKIEKPENSCQYKFHPFLSTS
jgi:hypothetical protein